MQRQCATAACLCPWNAVRGDDGRPLPRSGGCGGPHPDPADVARSTVAATYGRSLAAADTRQAVVFLVIFLDFYFCVWMT